MAKTENITKSQNEPNLTTRRGFSKWLAGVGMVAAVPVVVRATGSVSQELISSAAIVKAKSGALYEAAENVQRCEALMTRWKKRNLVPDSSDAKYTMEKYWEVLSADKSAWCNRHMTALKDSGVGKAKLRLNEARDELDTVALLDFADIKCVGLADLLFKAKIGAEFDNEQSIIARALLYDLLDFHDVEI